MPLRSTVATIYRVAAIPVSPSKILATGYNEGAWRVGMAANASVAAVRLGAEVACRVVSGKQRAGGADLGFARRMQTLVRALVGVTFGADGFLLPHSPNATALKCARVGGRNGAPTRAEVDALLREVALDDLSELGAETAPEVRQRGRLLRAQLRE